MRESECDAHVLQGTGHHGTIGRGQAKNGRRYTGTELGQEPRKQEKKEKARRHEPHNKRQRRGAKQHAVSMRSAMCCCQKLRLGREVWVRLPISAPRWFDFDEIDSYLAVTNLFHSFLFE
jgi:hypothetical protein